MSTTATSVGVVAANSPVSDRIRAYFATVDRTFGKPTIFDPAQSGLFVLKSPPAPWIDLGWCSGFRRQCGTKILPMRTGAPAVVQQQVRTELEGTISLEFESWGKLQLALSSGSQQMNLLAPATGAIASGSGGKASAAVALLTTGGTSTATILNVGAVNAGGFSVGDIVAVDVDYTGASGYVGTGVSGSFVKSGSVISDLDYVRRITLNVGRVVSIANGMLSLSDALMGGAPGSNMKVSRVLGFVDREGGSFFQEWSGLLCADGMQGDRVLYHYPRLQVLQGSAEVADTLTGSLQRLRLAAAFRALPVIDPIDGEAVLCFRSYLPSPHAAIS